MKTGFWIAVSDFYLLSILINCRFRYLTLLVFVEMYFVWLITKKSRIGSIYTCCTPVEYSNVAFHSVDFKSAKTSSWYPRYKFNLLLFIVLLLHSSFFWIFRYTFNSYVLVLFQYFGSSVFGLSTVLVSFWNYF